MTDPQPLFDLNGKTALVTGAAQGIGRGIALSLAEAGANIVIADLNLSKAQKVAEEIKLFNVNAIALVLDVTDQTSVEQALTAALATFSPLDILVNNAGVHCERIGKPTTIDQFNVCLDINLQGLWRMTQAVVPHFKQQKSGKIINIASINGRKPWAATPAYSASKAAAINLTQSLATNLGKDNINVNAVCPGGVMTAMADMLDKPESEVIEGMIKSRFLKRLLEPADIGHAVTFLASAMADKITGQSINVDGGAVLN